MKVLVTFIAVLAVTAAAPTGKSWGVPISLAPHRISYNYAPQYYVPVHLQRLVAPAPAPVIIPYSSGGSSRYHVQDEYGQYQYGYVNADGQSKTEVRGIDGSVAGKFSYYDPNGKHIQLSYVADKGGFRASGDHLPKQVELPDDLQEAYDEAKDRITQTRRATAHRRAQKAALSAYQAASRSYSHIRPPTVYYATYPQAAKAPTRLVQTYAQVIPTQTRVVQAVPAQSKVVQTYVQAVPVAQPRPAIVQAFPQVFVQAPAAAPSSGDDGGAEDEDDDDDDDDKHDDGKYDHEKQEEELKEHDDGKYRPEDDAEHHDDGQYHHDDAGDDDDGGDGGEDDDQDKGDGESDGDDKKAYTSGVFAVVPGQTVVATPVQAVYAAPAAAPAKFPAAVASPGVYVAQAQPRPVQPTVGVVRPAVYTGPAPATVGVVRPAVYSIQAPTPTQATVPIAHPAIYSAPSQPSVSAVRPVYSAQFPVQSPALGVVRSTYTSPGPAPVSFSVSQPVAPPSGSPVIATKVKTYTSTGTVGSPYASHGGAAAGAAGRLSSYSVSAQIPVSSVPVATPQVTVPVYAAASGTGGYKSHGVAGSAPAVPTAYRPTFSAAPQAAAAPAGQHVKSGYNYPG